jgi:Holliday junction resolvase-like predicted endonuclease
VKTLSPYLVAVEYSLAMGNFNEQIVKQYFELKGYYLQSDVKFPVPRNYSDIDLIGFSSGGKPVIVEVKGWHTTSVGKALGVGEIDAFLKNERMWKKAEAYLGKSRTEFEKVNVFSELGKDSREAVKKHDKANGVDVLEFPEILVYLFKNTETGPEPSSEVLQMVRVIKQFGKTIIGVLKKE